MSVYADSSFFVSYYLQDSHGAEVNRRMALFPRIFLTSFQRVELIHAIYQHVFRSFISPDEAIAVTSVFENDCRSGLWVLVRQPEGMYDAAVLLAKQHVATLGVRTLDSLHVASALELKAMAFWTFDQRQARLAEAEGLQVN